MSRVYFVTLAKSVESPFKPKSDEVATKEDKPKDSKKDDKKDDKKDAGVSVKVDADGIKEGIGVLPIDPSNYGNIASIGSKLYYIRAGSKDPGPQFMMYDLDALKETNIGEVNGYELSADRKKMIVGKGGKYSIIDVPKGKIDLSETINTSGMEVKLDKKAEWAQMYNESWRQKKYFFYAPNMHGVDWDAVKAKYSPLVPYVSHRADLTYIIGEMIGELNVGHAYVGGRDMPKPVRTPTGLLGARIERDAASGYYRIVKIYRGQNWERDLRSPLTEIGVSAKEGDYILAVTESPRAR